MKTAYHTATSLDGFIADENDSLAWLFATEGPGEGETNETDDFIATAGAILLGSGTYEWILREERPRAWPFTAPTWVLTHRDLPKVEGDLRFVAADTDDALRAVHKEMVAAADGRDVWVVGGGGVVADLARLGLLDEVFVSIAPITLGAGAPLLSGRVDLKVLDVYRAGGFACARYAVVKE